MADVFVDCEWLWDTHEMIILGAYSPGQEPFQLCGETLRSKMARKRFQGFLMRCGKKRASEDILIFCHGPDIHKIEERLRLNLKDYYHCVTAKRAFNIYYPNLQSARLEHLEKLFGVPRRYSLDPTRDKRKEINRLWFSDDKRDQQFLLKYNMEDCRNLWRVINKLKIKKHVNIKKFQEISMERRVP
jgi:hypothetical protein